jgi:DNA-binding MarR family transcriptional regulator
MARLGSLEAGLGFRLGRAHRLLREEWEREIADLGLSAAQAAMLRSICEESPTGLRQLARRMTTDPMNAKRLADHLESAGLVRSMDDPSHSQRRDLAPTQVGLAVAGQLANRATAWNRRLSRRMGAVELDQLRRLLARLEETLAVDVAGHPGTGRGSIDKTSMKGQRK